MRDNSPSWLFPQLNLSSSTLMHLSVRTFKISIKLLHTHHKTYRLQLLGGENFPSYSFPAFQKEHFKRGWVSQTHKCPPQPSMNVFHILLCIWNYVHFGHKVQVLRKNYSIGLHMHSWLPCYSTGRIHLDKYLTSTESFKTQLHFSSYCNTSTRFTGIYNSKLKAGHK